MTVDTERAGAIEIHRERFAMMRERIAERLKTQGLDEKVRGFLREPVPEDALLMVSRDVQLADAVSGGRPELIKHEGTLGRVIQIGFEVGDDRVKIWRLVDVAYVFGDDLIPANPNVFDEADVEMVAEGVSELAAFRRESGLALEKNLRRFSG